MSATEATITLEESASRGTYTAHLESYDDVAELTFSKAGETMIIVDHTGVPDSLRGLGLGAQLGARVVADAREKGVKIIPLCPFFKAQALKHDAWHDVVKL